MNLLWLIPLCLLAFGLAWSCICILLFPLIGEVMIGLALIPWLPLIRVMAKLNEFIDKFDNHAL